jgi:predicted DsbA family dithiol-disulfide isomerase
VTVQVEIWSDVVCPWCAIGKVRFERALAVAPYRDEVDVLWRSFQLDPSTPHDVTGDNVSRLAAKYGTTVERARAMVARVEAIAADEGLDFDLANARPANTFDAHRLLHLARAEGVQNDVKDAFLRAAHVEREHVGDHDTLRRLATGAGLDGAAVDAVLATDRFAEEVRSDQEEAYELGCQGVPFFVLDRRFAIPGAQPTDAMRQALDRAHAEAGRLQVVGADAPGHAHDDHAHDASCADGACGL